MKIGVFGAKGRLGKVLSKLLSQRGYDVLEISRSNFDLDEFLITRKLNYSRLDLIINTIALTDVDQCEISPLKSFEINSKFPQVLAQYCDFNKIKLFHISTDYVFSGSTGGSYTESSLPDPVCIYGESKLQGEKHVLSISSNRNLVIRTAWLFDLSSKNFLTWLINELESSIPIIKVIDDQYGSPTSTLYLANQIVDLVESDAHNIIHVTNEGKVSWFEMASEIAAIKNFAIERIRPTKLVNFMRVAQRPINSSLISEIKTGSHLNPPISWKESLLQTLK